MRLAAVALAIMALTPLQAAASAHTFRDYGSKILTAPDSGDEMAFRTEFQHGAQKRSDGMFKSLEKVLGGQAPTLNFVPSVGSTEFHASATPATNTINMDPTATLGLVDDNSSFHSPFVNGLVHEQMHLRQTPQVLASLADREGGAQAFADLTTNVAAAQAGIPYTTGFYDGSYGPYVDQAKQKGLAWILGSQMGKQPVSWP